MRKCDATSDFNMIMIILTTSPNHSKAHSLGSRDFFSQNSTTFGNNKSNQLIPHSTTTFEQKYEQ